MASFHMPAASDAAASAAASAVPHAPSASSSTSRHPSHITSKIDVARQSSSSSRPFWSLEFFPPKTAQGQANLLTRMARMNAQLGPWWNNVTWGAGGTTRGRSLELAGRCQKAEWDSARPLPGLEKLDQTTEAESRETKMMEEAARAQRVLGTGVAPEDPGAVDSCLHLTCTNVDKTSLDETLFVARQLGIRNILALRGDPPRGDEYWVAADARFQRATDLIRYIRQEHGDWFCVGVAGYPEGYCDDLEKDIDRDVQFLKTKQEAGAEFVITQLFYDADVFVRWYTKCREAGITIPILPGIMPIQNYQSFRRMTNLCKATVPPEVLQALEPIRFDDAAVKDYGVQLAISMIGRIYLETDIRGFHFCTLNLEKSVRRVLEGLGWVQPVTDERAIDGAETPTSVAPTLTNSSAADIESTTRQAVERAAAIAANTDSKAEKTTTWDEFPNGRFGDARSPAFGEMDGYGVSLKVPPADALRIWGHPVTEDDVSSIFASYLIDTIQCIPWCDAPIFDETLAIQKWLLSLNLPVGGSGSKSGTPVQGKGWWTVGSQPAVDGVASTDPTYGFGPRDGYVYQKAFVEFFVSEQDKEMIKRKIEEEGNGMLSFFAGNRRGDFETNMPEGEVDAVTWGVFPGKEIAQPTIIEEESFKAWRDEAFDIWGEWALLFPKRSATARLLNGIGDKRWLMTVVHHDYKRPEALWEFLGCDALKAQDLNVASGTASDPAKLQQPSAPSGDVAIPADYTLASSPGKVLIAGGYLVLSPEYPGLVIATDSRFYSLVAAGRQKSTNDVVTVTIRSPQFVEAVWDFKLNITSGQVSLAKQSASSPHAGKSPFLYLSLVYALALAYQRVPIEQLRQKLQHGLDILIVADNDFYSQRAATDHGAAGSSSSAFTVAPTSSQLSVLPAFNPLNCAISKVHKTGLGSSAALTTSLVSSMLVHLGVVSRDLHDEDLVWLHNAAQLAHCAAQGKVGSGFDVSSAVWGSQIFRRFDPKAVEALLADIPQCAVEGESDAIDVKGIANLEDHLGPSNAYWKPSPLSDKPKNGGAHPTAFEGLHYTQAPTTDLPRPAPFQLPPGVHMILADVDAGSNTPSLVGKVLDWKKRKPEWAQQLFNVLSTSNQSLADAMLSLQIEHDRDAQRYKDALHQCSSSPSKTWGGESLVPDGMPHSHSHSQAHAHGDGSTQAVEEGPLSHLISARNSLRSMRAGMRELGRLSTAPIEPDSMGRLLQSVIDGVDGVIGGSVPGAGGFDALYLLYVAQGEEERDEKRRAIEGVLRDCKEEGLSVGVLLTKAGEARTTTTMTPSTSDSREGSSSSGGLRLHKIQEVTGLSERLTP
ncbi:unnamed protein product [Jaminaea pallidilutea]